MIREQRQWLEWITFPVCEELVPGYNKVYLQSNCKKFLPFYVRVPFSTMIIDLGHSVEQLVRNYKPVTRYEIRRIEQDHLDVWYDQEIDAVIELFQFTAEAKGLNPLNRLTFRSKPEYVVSHIGHSEAGTLAAHFYLPDSESQRVKLYYNCSAYRKFKNSSLRSLCGRANRYLFHKDFLYFKERGFRVYDFGGYNPDTNDPAVLSVNRFKETLGGKLEEQFNYYPVWYWMFRKAREKWAG